MNSNYKMFLNAI